MSILKYSSGYLKDCEEVFDQLLNYGFQRSFVIAGTEKTLRYSNKGKEIRLIWELETINPWIDITNNDDPDLKWDQHALVAKIASKYPEAPTHPPMLNYWLFNTLSRKEYLNLYLNAIKVQLEL